MQLNKLARSCALAVLILVPSRAAEAATAHIAWDASTDESVTGYLCIYGTASGQYTKSVDAGNQLSCDIPGLLDGWTYYFAVKSYTALGLTSPPSSEVVGLVTGDVVIPMPVPAQITSPPVGTLLNSTAEFDWNAGTSVTAYWLNVGTSRGGYDIYSGYKGTSHSAVISGLPLNGNTIWVRVLSLTPLGWLFTDQQYKTISGGPGAVTTPAEGSLVTGDTVHIAWTPGTFVDGFWLDVGTTQGGYDIYSGYKGKSLSADVTLPYGGSRVWIRLRSLISGQWHPVDSSFLRPTPTPAKVTAPAEGSTLPGSTVTFTWDTGVGVDYFWVNIGRQRGGYDFYSNYLGSSLSVTVKNLPIDGSDVWVRLMSHMGGSWQWVDQKFTAAVPTPAQITSPPAGSALTMEPAVFNWSAGVFVDAYWLNVGTSQGGYDLYSGYMGNTRAAAINLPVISKKLWVRLYSHIGTQWYFVDVPYSSAPAVPAQIVTPAPGSTITAGTVTLAWSKGRAVQAYWLDVGTAQGGYDLSSGYRGTSQAASIPGVPVGTIWVRIWSLIDGSWRFVDAKFTAK